MQNDALTFLCRPHALSRSWPSLLSNEPRATVVTPTAKVIKERMHLGMLQPSTVAAVHADRFRSF